MKSYKRLFDAILLLGLLGLMSISILPKSMVMSNDAQMILLALVFILVSAFIAFLWREHPADERELLHVARASRLGYVIGCAVLIIALVWQQVVGHHDDPTAAVALFAMIATKLIMQSRFDRP